MQMDFCYCTGILGCSDVPAVVTLSLPDRDWTPSGGSLDQPAIINCYHPIRACGRTWKAPSNFYMQTVAKKSFKDAVDPHR